MYISFGVLVFILLIILVAFIITFSKIRSLNNRLKKLEQPNRFSEVRSPTIPQTKIKDPIIDRPKEETLLESLKEEFIPPVSLPTKNQNLEKSTSFLKDNFLTIVGIVTFVLGVGYFIKYAIDQDWISEIMRIFISLIVGFALIFLAHRLKNQNRVFSSILAGGGLSILYISILFAFREYQLISQNFTFILLVFVTLLAIVLSFLYDRVELSVLSFVGAFAAPIMISSGESNYPFLFTYLLILNLANLFIYYRKSWKILLFINFVLTFVFVFNWANVENQNRWLQTVFFGLIFLEFLVLSLVDFIKKKEFETIHSFLFLSNQLFTLIAICLVYPNQEFWVCLVFAIFNGLMFGFLSQKEKNLLTQNLQIVTISLLTLAIPFEFGVSTLSVIWSIFTSILVFLWYKSHQKIYFYFFLLVSFCAFFSLVINWFQFYTSFHETKSWFHRSFITNLFCLASLLINIQLLKRSPDFKLESFIKIPQNNIKTVYSVFTIFTIYVSFLLEVNFHNPMQLNHPMYFSVLWNFTLFYLMLILILRSIININHEIQFYLTLVGIFLAGLYPIIFRFGNFVQNDKISTTNFWFYALYLLPTIYFFVSLIVQSRFKKYFELKFTQWFLLVIGMTILSFEFYNIYLLINFNDHFEQQMFMKLRSNYNLIILPIIWVLIAFVLIYFGLRRTLNQLPIMAFTILVLIILKLYLFDVWQMDNLSRIIAFLVLGVLILIISFTYQRLKTVLIQMIDVKDEDNSN